MINFLFFMLIRKNDKKNCTIKTPKKRKGKKGGLMVGGGWNSITIISKFRVLPELRLWSKPLHNSTQIQFKWNWTCYKSLHLDKSDHLPF
jgi:hypothetical protein